MGAVTPMAELVPIKCPVCGAPIDIGATKCKYCETSFYHDVHHNAPDDIDVLYADGTPIAAMYCGKVVSPEIETQLKNGTIKENEVEERFGVTTEQFIEALSDFWRIVY